METLNIPYSLKNIPISHKKSTIEAKMVESAEDLFRRMRWKLFHFENPGLVDRKNTFGFKTNATAPASPLLQDFEQDVLKLLSKIEYKKSSNPLQEKMKSDIEIIKDSKEILTKADKTSNIYKLHPEHYKKLLNSSIQAEYKKTKPDNILKVNKQSAEIAEKMELADRIDQLTKSKAFITIKDHKNRFPNNIDCRLINPSKNNIGQVSKSLLDKFNEKVRNHTKLLQWKNTNSVINWFKEIDKTGKKFLKFDIVQFYPSISSELMDKALNWFGTLIDISDDELKILKNARKSFLFNMEGSWVKKNNPTFDVTMGSLDGAELCEMVGLYILNELSKIIPKENIGLYRDDGLALVNGSGPQMERLRKDIHKLFKSMKLNVTIETNLMITDFLDVTLNLMDNSFSPYSKPGNHIKYVSAGSNHPPSIKKQIPIMVQNRLSSLSSNAEIFENISPIYRQALHEAGYNSDIKFIDVPSTAGPKKTRNRNIIWFRPPWSDSIATNVGGKFLQILRKRFPKENPLGKLFNKNNVKISYGCLPNMNNIIAGHNIKLQTENITENGCNCRVGISECPVNGRCTETDVVYKVDIITGSCTNTYIGSTQNFKERFNQHMSSLRLEKYKNSTCLSTHIWDLKEKGINYSLKWNIIAKAKSYNPEAKKCHLCITEKAKILYYSGEGLLNKRSEIMAKCRHRAKHKLAAV